MNIADILIRTAATHPNEIAVHGTSDFHSTYQTLLARAQSLATYFTRQYGLQPGDRVAFYLEHRCEYVELYFAAWIAGLAVVPIDCRSVASVVGYILGDSKASLVVVSDKTRPALQGCSAARALITLNLDQPDYAAALASKPSAVAQCDPDTMAWLFYSPVASEAPLGVIQTHRNLYAMINAFLAQVKKVRPGEALYHGASMAAGNGYCLLPFVAVGGYQLIPDSGCFDACELGGILEQHLAVSLLANGLMIEQILGAAAGFSDNAMAGLDSLICCGEPLQRKMVDKVHNQFGHRLLSVHGHGECPLSIAVLDLVQHRYTASPDVSHRLSSAGLPMFGIDIKVATAQGESLPANTVGHIMVRGDAVTPGFWRNPEANRKRMFDGWLDTGDRGYQDETGFIFLTEPTRDDLVADPSHICKAVSYIQQEATGSSFEDNASSYVTRPAPAIRKPILSTLHRSLVASFFH